MAASQNGHVEVVDKLLQHGATVDLQTKVLLKFTFQLTLDMDYYIILNQLKHFACLCIYQSVSISHIKYKSVCTLSVVSILTFSLQNSN